jgi:hypothetical protein
MSISLGKEFEAAMRDGSLEYQKIVRSSPTRYLQLIHQFGGVGAAIKLALDPHLQSGLQKAAEYDCVELTSEYLIIHGKGGAFADLFAPEVREAAAKKLSALYEYRDVLRARGKLLGKRS